MNVPAPKHPVGVESAGIVVLDADDRVLVVHRPLQNDWSLPKGHLEPGETYREAAEREVEEETGVIAEAGAWLTDCYYTDRRGRAKRVVWFAATTFDSSGASDRWRPNSEVDEVAWLGSDELDRLSYAPDREAVAKRMAGRGRTV